MARRRLPGLRLRQTGFRCHYFGDMSARAFRWNKPRTAAGRPVVLLDRPNPIGLHPVTVRAIEGRRLRIGPIEAIDGTPVLDLKPLLA